MSRLHCFAVCPDLLAGWREAPAMILHSWLFLALQGVILLVLVVQYLQGGRLSRTLDHWHATTRERQRREWWHAEENRELKQALQAEKMRVAQLQRSVEALRAQV